MTEPRLRRSPGVLWRRSLDAVVLVAPGSADLVTLVGTGPAVWELLADWRTLDDLAAILADAFGASSDQVRADLEPILSDLTAAGALQTAADSGTPRGE